MINVIPVYCARSLSAAARDAGLLVAFVAVIQTPMTLGVPLCVYIKGMLVGENCVSQ